MDFESPDNMKDYPDSDGGDKMTKKELLMGKRKDKKDKKDKERGYAALEGESSADESSSRSPSKSKKTKPFKFSTKSKDKREKSSDKEIVEKKKDKEKKTDKKVDKDKKSEKKERKVKHLEEGDLSEKLPIFGAKLDVAIERSRCHDGVDIPLPVRVCIDHVQANGLYFEGVYKVTGTKSKVLQLRKMFNCREEIDCTEYDIPTVTSLLKLYLRDLPEPVLTSDLLIRFEEAGAILNVTTREKHLKILIESLPTSNKLLLSYLLLHFDNVISNEKANKVNLQTLITSLSPILHLSNRLFTALLYHCQSLFPNTQITRYIPPLKPNAQLPIDPDLIEEELKKQESLLAQIHAEIQEGFIARHREELMWEVQRIITQLKRTYKNVMQKDKEHEKSKGFNEIVKNGEITQENEQSEGERNVEEQDLSSDNQDNVDSAVVDVVQEKAKEESGVENQIELLQIKNKLLLELKNKLQRCIDEEKGEIGLLKQKLTENNDYSMISYNGSGNLEELMDLLSKENQILQIKKINLVRRIMEQQEICVDLKAKLCISNV
ncbi:ralA-binding protein 1-like [Onthophagus taurus]|uniref:ralA-binding protein 1-like n=1 Tax=Onthophagus taurus TaxID=166361 RepID=UPI0039BE9177